MAETSTSTTTITTFIGDITVPNPDFRFVYDVRLSQYPTDADNLALAKAYQWTNQQIGSELPSVQVLETICNAFEFEKEEPRRVLQATYGHGKSHLALALANFFGQPAGSPEVEAVLAGVKHVAPGVEARLRTFKEERTPYLVLRLTGGGADSLSAAVVRGFETALQENPATKGIDLGLWFDKALAALAKFSPEQVTIANSYLEIHAAAENLDVGALRATLQGAHRDGRHRELIHKLVEHVLGVYPNFGAALSPRELMNHMGREYCGPGKPFTGILVLFDEFAAFVEAYARQYGLHTDSLPLQSLLDGISDLRQAEPGNPVKLNKAVFLAFSQQDPDDVAELAMQERGAGKSALADLKKELTRLPNEARHPLYSPMEAVLDAYLKQDKAVWDALTPDDSVADNDVIDAVDSVRNFFPMRYTAAAGWDLDKIRMTMAYGCHPLHPVTTALLCSATLRAGSGARTVLSFVKDTMLHCKRRPAIAADGRLCWIRPIALVAYYQHQLVSDDAWKQYQTTLRKAIPANIPDTEAILQAILLYETAGFKPGDTEATDYNGALAVLTGLSRTAVRRALTTLCDTAGYIEYDSVSETYRFWANNQDGSQVRQAVVEGLEKLKRDEIKWLAAVNEGLLSEEAKFTSVGEVAFHNTTGGDWGARVVFVPRAQWSAPRLATLLKLQTLEANGRLADAARGYVIAPLAADEAEVQWLRQHAEKDLNQAIASFSDQKQVPPVVVILPKKSHEALLNGLLELNVLGNLSEAQKRTLGTEPITQRRTTVRNNVQSALDALKDDLRKATEYQVPSLHLSGIESRLTGKKTVNLAHVLQAAYETVYYRFAPYLGDSTRGTNLRAAVGLAVPKLYRGSFVDWDEAARNMGRARDLYSKVLRVGTPASWGVVDTSERVTAPKLPLVKHAWEVLEAAVPPGAKNHSLRPALLQLLNAPYGYDPWSLGILFGTWYGVNRHQLEITDQHKRPLEYKSWLGTSNDFRGILETMLHTYNIRASRRNEEVVEGEVQSLVTKLRYAHSESISLAEAEPAVQQLSQYADTEGGNPGLRKEAKQAAEQLGHELKQAQEYERRITEGIAALETVPTTPGGIKQLIELVQLFNDPTKAGVPLGMVVPPSQQTIGQGQKRAAAKLRQLLTEVAAELANISSLRGYDLSKRQLGVLLSLVSPLGEPDLDRRIRDAEQLLEERHDEFSKEGQDAGIREKITEARRANSLADWRELLAYFQGANPKADSTVSLVAEATLTLNTKRLETEAWLLTMCERANTLTEAPAIASFERDLNRKAAQFEGTPEADQIKELERKADRVSKLLSNLKDQRREKPKTADDVRKVVREYERLAAREGLSEVQIGLVSQERADFERRFDEQRQAARQKLDELVARNEAQDAPAPLLTELERRLEFLPDEDKPRRDALDKDLRRRVAKDKASVAEKAFLDIGNRAEQKACLVRLQGLLDL
ncbi:coiled-coil domain-containing protein [Hymenobacter jejuensis]|uniref:Uncharacterized protein n=1 Tax=Hymenobacter jejuensis TaxID=2502781 RepID=A0A5B7ZYN4_9BACT|nr:hypothetical protein [Hymenobacter jejuensis]QDA59997.1 hypothetical protein FHG12_07675 [Hymenobacter jejuensis]